MTIVEVYYLTFPSKDGHKLNGRSPFTLLVRFVFRATRKVVLREVTRSYENLFSFLHKYRSF